VYASYQLVRTLLEQTSASMPLSPALVSAQM
jgi:hypothetical protein